MKKIEHAENFIKEENESVAYQAEINYVPLSDLPVEVFASHDLKGLKAFAKNVSKLSCVTHVIIKYYGTDLKICGY